MEHIFTNQSGEELIRQIPPQHRKRIRALRASGVILPRWLEYAYYALLFYAVMGLVWELSVPLLGAVGMALLAAYCVWRLRSAISIYKPIVFPLGCALSFLVIQIAIHGTSLMDAGNRAFVNWAFALIIIQSLSTRHRFLHSFALALLAIEICLLPYLTFHDAFNAPDRAALGEGIALANPNALGAWFGFSSVYFVISGIEAKRIVMRIGSWLLAVGSLYMVALTVSRGPMFAALIAAIVALRHVLKRGFGLVLALAVLTSIAYESGLLEQSMGGFAERGMEETGREILWPAAIESFLNSPFTGAGSSVVESVRMNFSGIGVAPHNGLLFIAMGSGILPLAFFLAFWISAVRAAFRARTEGIADAPFYLPLLIFVSIEMMILDGVFMESWFAVASLLPISAVTSHRMRYARALQLRRDNKMQQGEHQVKRLHGPSRVQT